MPSVLPLLSPKVLESDSSFDFFNKFYESPEKLMKYFVNTVHLLNSEPVQPLEQLLNFPIFF